MGGVMGIQHYPCLLTKRTFASAPTIWPLKLHFPTIKEGKILCVVHPSVKVFFSVPLYTKMKCAIIVLFHIFTG